MSIFKNDDTIYEINYAPLTTPKKLPVGKKQEIIERSTPILNIPKKKTGAKYASLSDEDLIRILDFAKIVVVVPKNIKKTPGVRTQKGGKHDVDFLMEISKRFLKHVYKSKPKKAEIVNYINSGDNIKILKAKKKEYKNNQKQEDFD